MATTQTVFLLLMLALALGVAPQGESQSTQQASELNDVRLAQPQRDTAEELALPRVQCKPTRKKPFIFFRQRVVCNQGWIATLINATVRALNLTASPCWAQSTCANYNELSPGRDWSEQVVGAPGLTWSQAFFNAPGLGFDASASCVTVMAPVVERVTGCMRTVASNFALELQEFTPSQIVQALPKGRGSYGISCLNEALRIFSGHQHEDALSMLHKDMQLAQVLTRIAKRHMSRCLILMSDANIQEMADLLLYWFPWLWGVGQQTLMDLIQHGNRTFERPIAHELYTLDQHRAIVQVDGAEHELYQWARNRYKLQLKQMREGPHTSTCGRHKLMPPM